MTEQTEDEARREARLTSLIKAYGANPAHWPPAERAEAVRLAEAAPERWALPLAAARRLDAMLDQAPALAPRWPLVARILAAAPMRGPAPVASRPHRRLLVSSGLAAACAAGVVFGFFAATAPLTPAASSDVGAVAALLVTDAAEG